MSDKKNTEVNMIHIVFLILLIVFIFFMLFVFFYNPSSSDLDSNLVEKEEVCDDDCLFDRAFSKEYYYRDDCLKIEDPDLENECLVQMRLHATSERALSSDDVSLCTELNVESLINKCKDNYYLIKAFNTGNKSYCDYLSREDLKNEC
jgi:hypothetical protein